MADFKPLICEQATVTSILKAGIRKHICYMKESKPENQRQIPEDQTCLSCDVQEPQNCLEAWGTVHDI